MKRILRALIVAASCLSGCQSAQTDSSTSAASSAASTSGTTAAADTEGQWALLSEAYRYLYPLVLMNSTMKSSTNTESADNAGHAPVNQLIHSQHLATSDSKLVVTPNVDTVYTQAWLDLSEEPMLYVKPETDRFFQVQVLDAWTNTPTVLKEAGTYLLTTPDWTGTVPDNVTRVEVPTTMVWLIGRVLVNDEADLANVKTIQSQMKLLPLSAYQSDKEYVPAAGTYKKEYDVVPVTAVTSMNPQTFFDTANQLMTTNPPASADADLISRLAQLNIGPGLTFDVSVLTGDVAAQWKTMLQSLRQTLVDAGSKHLVQMGMWTYFGTPIGNFGTAYDYRAMIALGGLGANPLDVAIYSKTAVDSKGDALSGKHSYQLHFDTLPPTLEGGFWSVTAYGSDDFLIHNELNRYCINDRSKFQLNKDGSLDITLSATAPKDPSNWLPVSTDEFHLFLRIYLPDTDAIDGGWTAPTITRIEAN